jgi:hypothetical protein
MEFVSQLARHLPLVHIKEIVGVDDVTACRWDKAVLQRKLPPPDLYNLRILLIDEKSVRRNHGYVTLVMNGQTVGLATCCGRFWQNRLPHSCICHSAGKPPRIDVFHHRLTNQQGLPTPASPFARAGG